MGLAAMLLYDRYCLMSLRRQILVGVFGIALPALASAQPKPAPDPLRDCETLALAQSKSEGGTLKSIRIERGDSLHENRYDRKVGSQYVSSEYIAWAAIEDADGKRRARIVCLHTGTVGNKAVYVLEVPK
ncbi:MAG TPA: hypothetical protein VGN82_24170 [Bosea sp. (in: a-proteobacteria)]|uniref:hypothetical protein n=1 Tax=Bosea sp. (in: a-proteobacteria) TaxID=1871050 RepID=UPI002E0EFB96|nr:hypothetical protein [Bosea sp. (in: a-proteobacteria)]